MCVFFFFFSAHSLTRKTENTHAKSPEIPEQSRVIFAHVFCCWVFFLPNTVLGSTVSNVELSEFFGPTEFRGENSVSAFQSIIAIASAMHRGDYWEISESAPGSAPESALGNWGALAGAPEGAQGNWGCPLKFS